jgi:hypothetical protein
VLNLVTALAVFEVIRRRKLADPGQVDRTPSWDGIETP